MGVALEVMVTGMMVAVMMAVTAIVEGWKSWKGRCDAIALGGQRLW